MKDALRFLPEIVSSLGEGPLLIATDFDGTLCPIADTPSAVRTPLAIVELLSDLQASRNAPVAIISGRSLDDLESRAPVPAILAGNHGLEIRGPGMEFRHPVAADCREEIESARERVERAIARWPGAWVEDKGLSITVHYRAVLAPFEKAVAFAVRQSIASSGMRLGVRAAKKALEIHPRCAWSKGHALKWIRARLGLDSAMCLAMGDDRMDEAMFEANPDGINIRVGAPERSYAEYMVRDPLALAGVLACVARAMRGQSAGVLVQGAA
jgi:trehalose 6-phosphate phosphatase